jgi:transposase-like protein
MSARVRHSEETKAKAMAMFYEGHTASHVAKVMKLNINTTKRWYKDRTKLPEGTKSEHAQSLDALLLEAVSQSLITQIAILKVASDEKWIRKQSAGELATFYGVSFDKAVRLLEAFNAARDHGAKRGAEAGS